jgi:hypothetical protein
MREIAVGIEPGIRIAAFAPADHVVVKKRIDAGGRDIGIVPEVVLDIEPTGDPLPDRRVSISAFREAARQEVRERVDAGRRNIRVVDQIERRIEPCGGIAALLPAAVVIVVERIDSGGRHVLVDRKVSRNIEHRIRIAPLAPAEGVEVVERVHAGMKHIRVAAEIVQRVEQRTAVVGRRERTVGELQVLDAVERVGAVRPLNGDLVAQIRDLIVGEIPREYRGVVAGAAVEHVVPRISGERIGERRANEVLDPRERIALGVTADAGPARQADCHVGT